MPRFLCRACGRRFSSQTFRLDYRWQKPRIDRLVFQLLVSKVTHRQSARVLRVNRKTIERRLRRFASALHEFHRMIMDRARRAGGMRGTYSLDELETFESNRRLQPVTVPVLIERHTLFVCHAETAPLPARGGIGPREREKRQEKERATGPRRSGSREAVDACLGTLQQAHDPRRLIEMVTDQKRAYRQSLKSRFAGRMGAHVTESSKRTRNRANPLFAINHTLAMMRDQISRLVRRSWGASKCRQRLLQHIHVWMAWRNYVRPITNRAPRVTPASALLLVRRPLSVGEILRWRWPALMQGAPMDGASFLVGAAGSHSRQ